MLGGFSSRFLAKFSTAAIPGIRVFACINLIDSIAKAVIFANLISRLPRLRTGANKVLILAHREELLAQAQRQIQYFAPHLKVSIERGKHWSNHEDDDVIIASVPTLGRIDSGSRLERFDPDRFKAIIIDEAHHSVADTYIRILKHFKVLDVDETQKSESEALVWGCSATLCRNDELVLGKVFDRIVFHTDIVTLMNNGWLCRAETKEIYTDIDLQKIKIRNGDFEMKELSLAIDTPVRNELVAEMWNEIANENHKRKSTIVFALNVSHARNLAVAFDNLGVQTALITGETNELIRRDTLRQFAAGKIPIILNCAVLTEGTDLPITDCIVMTRPTCNPSLYIQMVGRGLRKHVEKDYCLVLDFIDKIRSRSRSLITFPSLVASKQEFKGTEAGDYEAPSKHDSKEVDLDKISIKVRSRSMDEQPPAPPGFGLAWILLDNCNFALSSREETFLLELNPENRNLGKLYAVQHCRTPIPVAQKSRLYFEKTAINEDWLPVHEVVPILISRLEESGSLENVKIDAYWRQIRPLTVNQRTFLFRLLAKVPGIDSSCTKMVCSWSVGRASDLISKYYLRYRLLKRPFESFDDFLAGVEDYR